MPKTKIVATLGPACCDAAAILSLIERGVDVFRINFSQGTLDQHLAYLEALNHARLKAERIVALMGDLCGPKIRTGHMTPDAQTVKPGEFVTIESGFEKGNVHHFDTNYEHFVTDVRVGHRVFIDDGKVALKVIQQDEKRVVCEVILGGVLKSRKGINLPDRKPFDISLGFLYILYRQKLEKCRGRPYTYNAGVHSALGRDGNPMGYQPHRRPDSCAALPLAGTP